MQKLLTLVEDFMMLIKNILIKISGPLSRYLSNCCFMDIGEKAAYNTFQVLYHSTQYYGTVFTIP